MHRLDKDATVYNYTLVKRIRHRPLPLLLYGVLPLPAALFMAVSVSPWSLLWIAAALVLLPMLYGGMTALYLKQHGSNQRGPWTFAVRWPWLGLLPEQHTPLKTVVRIHDHILWVGLAVIGCFYPWLPTPYWIAWLALHVWYLIPRFWIFLLLRRSKKNGLLKINPRDTSFYVE
ncbi:hypothetical protein [Paenibacillus flagellatus]|uniref:Uncharacterized protein n=1 Tax=Paenibacillus flagellatus TaxID=2211139 RepID=A0A2V5JY52_9BACL|nr:hypothetical protein [Paenibacillus flagellatus]PYI50194.1 hypothetical protein DLM86_30125 [Paenibacillus flagellatus]